MEKRSFGKLKNGKEATLYTLRNKNGMKAEICDYGAVLVSLIAPDRNQEYEDIVHGYENVEGYFVNDPYFGAIVGRVAGDFSGGVLNFEGKQYQLSINYPGIHRHGGTNGFSHCVWDVKEATESHIELTYHSVDGDEGYPGEVSVLVVYTLTEDDSIEINYSALSNQDTVLNLTNHSYFNLEGNMSDSIEDHFIQVRSDGAYVNDVFQTITGTMIDLSVGKNMKQVFESDDPLVKSVDGIDYFLTLSGEGFRQVAEAYAPKTGRCMKVFTDCPSLILYTGNFLDGKLVGKNDKRYKQHSAFCMETCRYPVYDGLDYQKASVIRAGRQFVTKTKFGFSVR